jgi:RNA polymerase primary sigma factor
MRQIETTKTPRISRSIETERYLKELKNFKILPIAEEKLLLFEAQVNNSLEARDKLVIANLRFVVNVAAEFQSANVDIMDLIAVGNMGLIKAVEKFDRTKDIKFYSYAVWWIRNYIIVFLRDTKLIRLPYNQQDQLTEYEKVREKLERKHEVEVDSTMVIEEMKNVDFDYFRFALGNTKPASLDMHVANDGSRENDKLSDMIPSSNWDFTENFEDDSTKKALRKVISKLTPTQQTVIKLSFGLENNQEYSCEAIAEELNLTTERVRQIRRQSLDLLRKRTELKSCS